MSGEPVPLTIFEAVLARAIHDLNAATNNRVKGLRKGKSRAKAFDRLTSDRPARTLTPLMRRRLNLVWQVKRVQPDGRIRFDSGLFGDATTQKIMLAHMGKDVLVGFDPKNFDAPAMVCHWANERKRGQMFLQELPAVIPTKHGSAEGNRLAKTEKRRITKAIKDVRALNPDAYVDGLRRELENSSTAPDRKRGADRVVELPARMPFSAVEDHDAGPSLSDFEKDRKLRRLDAIWGAPSASRP